MSLTDSKSGIEPIVRNITYEKLFYIKNSDGSNFNSPKKYGLHVTFNPKIQYENIISYKEYNSMDNDNYNYLPKSGNNKCFSCGCKIT